MKLKATLFDSYQTVYDRDKVYDVLDQLEFDAVPGYLPENTRIFRDCKITAVTPTEITFLYDKETYTLTPGNTIVLHTYIEGNEWSDGCVYDGTNYSLIISWPTEN